MTLTENIVSCYNKKEGLDYLVGYAVEIPKAAADKFGVYYNEENGTKPTVFVEKIRSDKVLPVSIIHGEIQYADASPHYKYLKAPGIFATVESNELCFYAQQYVDRYEEKYGEYHENKDPQELNLVVDFPSFGKQVESLEEDFETEYDLEELE